MKTIVRSTPRTEGIDPKAIYDLFRYYDENQTGVQSIMILRHDKVAAEGWWYPYRPDFTHMLFSMSKSFTSIAIGFAVQEGLITIQDKLMDYFADVLPEGAEPCKYMMELTIRDMLRMATGHVVEPSMNKKGEERWIYQFLTTYIEKEPGTHYLYNTPATYMLSALIKKVTGQTVDDYLAPRLFEPLGFASDCFWERSPEDIPVGGSGFNLRTEDIAKFGIFLRNRGSFEGKQLLDPAYIDEATAKQIDFVNHMNIDSRQGYGYQFWRCQPEDSYRAAGAYAQFCIILPRQEMVIAVTSGAWETQPVLNALWEILLPAVGSNEPAETDEYYTALLKDFSKSLTMPMPKGAPTAAGVSYWNHTYAISENPLHLEQIKFCAGEENTAVLTINGKESVVTLGCGKWVDGEIDYPSFRDPKTFRPAVPLDKEVSCCGAWTDERTFEMCILFNKTPFRDILTFVFDEYGLRLRHQRKPGLNLVDTVYFGRPVTDDAIQTEKAAEGPRAEYRF